MLIFEKVSSRITLVKLGSFSDHRGLFTKIHLPEEYSDFNQIYVTQNPHSRTLRGLHFQRAPFSERKIVLCLAGKIFDVAISLEPKPNAEREVFQITIGPDEEYQGIILPNDMAHGYITLESNTTLLYFIDQEYSPSHSLRLRWDDPSFGIDWPTVPQVISDADANAPYL